VVEGQQVPLKVYLNEQMKSMHAGILIHISVYRLYNIMRHFRSTVLPYLPPLDLLLWPIVPRRHARWQGCQSSRSQRLACVAGVPR
jgi:hypothetical protein